ncbi:vanadium-dependent haloperoxidase [Amycolatopsis sp. NPDC098790]|uniref:vanadium-dependent haloperoxidase n=1 Tax=Amycolatopsis sp. NPDC098790 TaxID=3363939 RepID=UPI003804DFDF
MFRTPGPPAVTSRTYARDFAEVKRLGSATSTVRTADQTEAGLWWHDRRSVADTDGNPATTADPGWTPLVITPPNPGYPSGHTCRTAAQMTAYAHYFGRDDVPFSVDSGTTRHFGSFSQATAEVVGARIWAGIHFRSADVDGTRLGAAVGNHITDHHLRPRV